MLSLYENWLRKTKKVSEASIKHYTGALKTISEQYDIAVWENTEYENFREIKNFIFSDNSFIAINKKGNQMYSAVLNHYEHYL